MAKVIITLNIMPTSPETDLDLVEKEANKLISAFGGETGKKEIKPVAFGLRALVLYFVMEESIGTTDKLEEQIAKVVGVESVEVIDVRRAIG